MFRTSSVASLFAASLIVLVPFAAAEAPPIEKVPMGPQDEEAFTPVAVAPTAIDGAHGAFVEMAKVPETPHRAKVANGYRSHVQGAYGQQMLGSHRTPISASVRGEPAIEIDVPRSAEKNGGAPSAPGAPVVGFDGASATGWIPPDTVIAVGPEYIVEAVNSGFQVYTKTGVQTRGYTDFSSFVNLPSPWNGFCIDPRVVYDPWSEQFIMLILGIDNTNLKSYFWIMVSKTSNPNGDWWLWRYDSTTGDPGSEQWLDYASLGSDPWGIYVVGNSFDFAQGKEFRQSRLWSLNRDLMQGGASNAIFWNGLRWPNNDLAFGLQVAQAHSESASQATYFINNYPATGSQVCLWKLTGERYVGQGLGPAVLSNSAIEARTYYGIFHNIDQPGSDWDIDGGDCRIQNAVYSLGKVYTTFALNADGALTYSEVYVAAFNTGDSTKAWDHAIWNATYFMFYPALAVEGGEENPNWMVAMSMTVPSDPTAFPGTIAVTHDPATDTGSFSWDRLGLGPYSVWDGGSEGVGKNRWGDYSMAVYDWSCDNAWGAAEYATASNSWATRIFARTLDDEPLCPYLHIESPNGGKAVVGGSTRLVEWSGMNIPFGDELYFHFHTATELYEYGPLISDATTYSWTVPDVVEPGAWVEIGAWNTTSLTWRAFDSSDSTFAVVDEDVFADGFESGDVTGWSGSTP